MARNEERRRGLQDAGLLVLAQKGGRGLTHRAVDDVAGLPRGTAVNYFRSRTALLHALATRIFERLTPSESELAESAGRPPSKERLVELMVELIERVSRDPHLHIALFELRLESTRDAELAGLMTQTLRRALDLDISFHKEAGLPGGRTEVILLHLGMEGLIWNLFTLPDVLEVAGREEIIVELVNRLVSDGS